MKHPTRRVDTELAVIGTGIAGFAAALLAEGEFVGGRPEATVCKTVRSSLAVW